MQFQNSTFKILHAAIASLKMPAVILILSPLYSVSQSTWNEPNQKLNISAGIGAALGSFNDKQFSSQAYSGLAPSLSAGAQYMHGANWHEISVEYCGANLETEMDPEQTAKWQYFQSEYTYLRKMGRRPSAWSHYLGGAITYASSTRKFYEFINLDKNYEKYFSASPAYHFTYNFPGTGHWSVSGRLWITLFSLLSQPYTGINNPPGSGTDENSADGQLTTFLLPPGFTRFKTFIQLEKQFLRGQKLILKYGWETYSTDSELPVSQAVHQLSILYRQEL